MEKSLFQPSWPTVAAKDARLVQLMVDGVPHTVVAFNNQPNSPVVVYAQYQEGPQAQIFASAKDFQDKKAPLARLDGPMGNQTVQGVTFRFEQISPKATAISTESHPKGARLIAEALKGDRPVTLLDITPGQDLSQLF